jgi:hypothetical protein
MEALMMKKRVLVGLALVCAASISAQDSLREKIESDWRQAEQAATLAEFKEFQKLPNELWRLDPVLSEKGGPPEVTPPPAPGNWSGSAPTWFSEPGKIRDYGLRRYGIPDKPPAHKGIVPNPLGAEGYRLAQHVYSGGPVSLTAASLWIPFPFALDVESNFTRAPTPVLEGGFVEYQWRVDFKKPMKFEPRKMTGVEDWLRHMGSSVYLDKWHYTFIDYDYYYSYNYPANTFSAMVRCGVNLVSGDVWFRIHVLDGDTQRDMYGPLHPVLGRKAPPLGFYVNAMYPGLLSK